MRVYAYKVSVAEVVRDRRESVGLSVRDLAKRAGVAASTVQRIETGRMDPTVSMVERLLAACGEDLILTTQSRSRVRIAQLHGAVRQSGTELTPDWTRLRSFVDYVTVHPEQVSSCLLEPPPSSGSALHDAVLAAIAEKLAHDHNVEPPRWVHRVPPLKHEWVAAGTPRMQAKSRELTPPEFAKRNIVMRVDNIWRIGAFSLV